MRLTQSRNLVICSGFASGVLLRMIEEKIALPEHASCISQLRALFSCANRKLLKCLGECLV